MEVEPVGVQPPQHLGLDHRQVKERDPVSHRIVTNAQRLGGCAHGRKTHFKRKGDDGHAAAPGGDHPSPDPARAVVLVQRVQHRRVKVLLIVHIQIRQLLGVALGRHQCLVVAYR